MTGHRPPLRAFHSGREGTEIQDTNFVCTQHSCLASVLKQDGHRRVVAISSGHPLEAGPSGATQGTSGSLGLGDGSGPLCPVPGSGLGIAAQEGPSVLTPVRERSDLRWKA